MSAEKTVTAYKAFDKDLKCRDFQFEIGKTYTHAGKVQACASGFHACENPLDMWSYYPVTESRFCIVELSGELSRHNEDSKIASGKITIKAEIGIPQIVTSTIQFVMGLVKDAKSSSDVDAASGYYSTQAASGYYSTQEITGKNGVAMAAGTNGKAKASEGGVFALRWDDEDRPRIAVGYVGENGIKSDTWYSVNSIGKFVEVEA